MATWMAAELYAGGGPDVAISLTPGGAGVFTVAFDGEIVFDKAQNDGKFPDLPAAKMLKKQIAERIAMVPVGGDD